MPNNVIDVYRVPIVDRSQTGNQVKEFFDGYFYWGDRRFEIIRDSKTNKIIERHETRDDHYNQTLLKMLSIPFVVPILVGACFFLYNLWDRSTHQYEYIPEARAKIIRATDARKNKNPIVPEHLIPRPEKPIQIPAVANLSFEAFMKQAYDGKSGTFTDYSEKEWKTLVSEYRKYINDNRKFVAEMLLLEVRLVNWAPSTLAREMHINYMNFVAQEVSEIREMEIDSLLKILEEMKGDKAITALEKSQLAQHQKKYESYFLMNSLKDATMDEAIRMKNVRMGLEAAQDNSQIIQMINNCEEKDVPVIMGLLRKMSANDPNNVVKNFIKNFYTSVNYPIKHKQFYVEFWNGFNKLPYKQQYTAGDWSLWREVIRAVSDATSKLFLATVPAGHADLKEIADDYCFIIRRFPDAKLGTPSVRKPELAQFPQFTQEILDKIK